MHIKRKTIGNFMPVPRTGTKYMAVPGHNQRDSMSLILVMRDILKLVKTKKELKKVLNEKKVLVNGKIVNETNYPLSLYDVLGLPSAKKYYRVRMFLWFNLCLLPVIQRGSVLQIGDQVVQTANYQLSRESFYLNQLDLILDKSTLQYLFHC